MFKKFMIVLALSASLFVSGLAYAATNVTVSWSANTESDIGGYKLHTGISSGVYGSVIDVGNVTSYDRTSVPDGTAFYALTAYDTSGNESGYSVEVMSVTDSTAPGSPVNVTVSITIGN